MSSRLKSGHFTTFDTAKSPNSSCVNAEYMSSMSASGPFRQRNSLSASNVQFAMSRALFVIAGATHLVVRKTRCGLDRLDDSRVFHVLRADADQFLARGVAHDNTAPLRTAPDPVAHATHQLGDSIRLGERDAQHDQRDRITLGTGGRIRVSRME